MTLEDTLIAILKARCPRVFKPVAPVGTEAPYVTWQHIGGRSLVYTENTQPEERNSFIQVTVWADHSGAAFALLRGIEQDLMASPEPSFLATPMEEPTDAIEDGQQIAGAMQSFTVWGER